MKKFLLGHPDDILKNSYIWNAIGGLLNAGQSALLLIIISRTNPVEDAGIFSIAYAVACLAVTVGQWGMRNFQATDVRGKYEYGVYVSSRIVTCAWMLLTVLYYIFKGKFVLGYTSEKCMAIFLMGMLKMLDAAEDVLHGMFQRKGRLDVGAKCMASRYFVMLCAYGVSLYVSHNLVLSMCVAFIASLAYFLAISSIVYGEFREKLRISFADVRIWKLLAECFSLFAGSFLTMYIANAPKYAIDKYMDEAAQARFNYIFMPVYVISVLNTFAYQPILTRLAIFYEEGKRKEFLALFFRQLLIIFGLALGVWMCGFMLGMPVLSMLYNTDLPGYRLPFMILLVGGSFLAISGYLGVVVTIIRKQGWLIIGYVLAAVIAFLASESLVLSKGVIGAAFLYTAAVLLQAFIFAWVFAISFRASALPKEKKF